MSDEIDRLDLATLKYEGVARTEPGDPLVNLFSFDGTETPVWLEVRTEWVGANYKAIVSNLVILNGVAALSTHPEMQAKFTPQEQETAMQKIREYLAGPGGVALAFGRGRCLDVVFHSGWIRIK